MKIRTESGVVEFEKGHIGPAISKAEFLMSALGTESESIVSNSPYETRRFTPEDGITATASFEGDRLTTITLMMELPTDKDRSWTEILERERKVVHDDWLRARLGPPPFRYNWGEVTSNFDAKGCISDIIISYAG